MLASAPGAGAQVTAEVIQDTAPKNLDNYPTITYWHKCVQLDEKNRRLEFTKTKPGSKHKHKSKGKNIAFWHFQYSDGTVLNYNEVKAIRKDSKKIWRKMCDKHGPIGVPWTTISPDRQLEFYVRIKAKHPFLWLCENHYKAESISFSDYSHWYNKWFPSGDTPEPARVCKCLRTASPVKSPQETHPAKKAPPTKEAPDDGNSSSDDSSSDGDLSSSDLSSEDESDKGCQDKLTNVDDPDADPPLHQLPFTTP
jgi:hypothetical protein